MKILYHHRTRGRHVEGVHIRGVVDALREMGHEVRVLSFPGADPEQESSTSEGTRRGLLASIVARLPGVLFEFMELAYNLVTLVRITAVIRRERPAVIYERYSLFLCATVWLARRSNIPLVLEINDSALVERVRPLWLKGLARRVEGWCFRHCTGLVFISSHFRTQAQRAYGNIAPSVISPNAADVRRFDPARFDPAKLRAERGLSDRVVCGHIGAFAHWHGMDVFIEALAARLDEVPHLTMVLVGDGRTLPAIRNLVSERGLADRILLPGRVAHEQIAEWIACMDYAVLPDSNHYGSPMKVFEFMAMGVAMIAPDYDPITEVIRDGETGWLFPRRQTAVCVQRVVDLATRALDRRQVGAAARDYIVRERQWRNNAEQWLALLPSGESRGC